MKTLIILITLILFSATSAYSKEAADCKNLKKFSIEAAVCKTKATASSIKNKWTKKKEIKKEAKNKSDKKSIFKKFGEAKTLSDLTK